jgi:hypothetical protein
MVLRLFGGDMGNFDFNKIKENKIILGFIFGLILFSLVLYFFFTKYVVNDSEKRRFVDKASGTLVDEIDQEPERAGMNYKPSVSFVGFAKLYEKIGAEKYLDFQNSVNENVDNGTFGESVKYVSLKRDSIKDEDDSLTFIIVIDNKMKNNFTVTFDGEKFIYTKN